MSHSGRTDARDWTRGATTTVGQGGPQVRITRCLIGAAAVAYLATSAACESQGATGHGPATKLVGEGTYRVIAATTIAHRPHARLGVVLALPGGVGKPLVGGRDDY